MISNFNEYITETSRRQKALQLFRDGKSKWKTFCIMAPENPMANILSRTENEELLKKFKEEIKIRKIPSSPVIGNYGVKEHSFILFAVSLTDCLELGYQFNQQSFIFGQCTDEGLVFSYYEKSEKGKYKLQETLDYFDITDRDKYFTIIGKHFKFNIPWKVFENSIYDLNELITERRNNYKEYDELFEEYINASVSDKKTLKGRIVARAGLFGEKYFIGHMPNDLNI